MGVRDFPVCATRRIALWRVGARAVGAMAGVIATGERLFQSRGLNINWFPGHMSSATKAIRERIKMVDMVIEVRDARIPLTSACAHLEELMQVPTHALRPRAALPRTPSGCTCLSWPISRAGPLGPQAESPLLRARSGSAASSS
jgi:hypothetical protein